MANNQKVFWVGMPKDKRSTRELLSKEITDVYHRTVAKYGDELADYMMGEVFCDYKSFIVIGADTGQEAANTVMAKAFKPSHIQRVTL